MAITKGEAKFIDFYRRLLSNRPAHPARFGHPGLGSEARSMFEAGMAKVVVRFLLEQGGVLGDLAVVNDEPPAHHYFWQAGPLSLRFSKALFKVLKRLYLDESVQAPAPSVFTVWDNVVLLMLTKAPPRAGLPSNQARRLGSLGYLPRLFCCPSAETASHGFVLPEEPDLASVLFSLHALMERCWLEEEEQMIMGHAGQDLERLLARAKRRHVAWEALLTYAEAQVRLDLLRPFCRLYARLFEAPGHVDRVMGALDGAGQFTHESQRQKAYRRFLAGYTWVADLDGLQRRARASKSYDEDYDAMSVFKAYFARIPKPAREQGQRLLSTLRFEI